MLRDRHIGTKIALAATRNVTTVSARSPSHSRRCVHGDWLRCVLRKEYRSDGSCGCKGERKGAIMSENRRRLTRSRLCRVAHSPAGSGNERMG